MDAITKPTRKIAVQEVCAGDRLWHNGQFVEVTSADRASNDIRLVCRVPNAPFDQLDFKDPTQTVTIEALPHAHRYWQDGPLTEEIIFQLLDLPGFVIQSKAGVYVSDTNTLLAGEWMYGDDQGAWAFYDPTITAEEAKVLLSPFFGRPMQVVSRGDVLVALIRRDEFPLLQELTSAHPRWQLGSGAGENWIIVSSLNSKRWK